MKAIHNMALRSSLYPKKKRTVVCGEEEALGEGEGLVAEASEALVLPAASCPSGTLCKMM